MWTKTVKAKLRGREYDVLVFFFDSTSIENGLSKETVRVQSMVNEYFLIEDIIFEDRDKAYDFIRHYPVSMAQAFLLREAYSNSAI